MKKDISKEERKKLLEHIRLRNERIDKVKWLNLKVICPYCGRVAKAIRVRATQTTKGTFRCKKCPMKEFEWTYYYPTPEPERNWYPRYGYIESKVGIFLGELPEMEEYNEKHVSLSNK